MIFHCQKSKATKHDICKKKTIHTEDSKLMLKREFCGIMIPIAYGNGSTHLVFAA